MEGESASRSAGSLARMIHAGPATVPGRSADPPDEVSIDAGSLASFCQEALPSNKGPAGRWYTRRPPDEEPQ